MGAIATRVGAELNENNDEEKVEEEEEKDTTKNEKREEENTNENGNGFLLNSKNNDKTEGFNCFNCGEKGHYRAICPHPTKTNRGAAAAAAAAAALPEDARRQNREAHRNDAALLQQIKAEEGLEAD